MEDELGDFGIKKLQYDTTTLALIIRMFSGCPPIGCSFEKEVEQAYFASKMTKAEPSSVEHELEAAKVATGEMSNVTR